MNNHEQDAYEIRIKGHLDEHRLSRLVDMSATPLQNGETLISGPVRDQAALLGLLNWIGDLGVPLVSVKRLDAIEDGES